MIQSYGINKGVRDGCPISFTLLNTRTNKRVSKWDRDSKNEINITRQKEIKHLHSVTNQIIITNHKTYYKSPYKKNKISKYGLTQSTKLNQWLSDEETLSETK